MSNLLSSIFGDFLNLGLKDKDFSYCLKPNDSQDFSCQFVPPRRMANGLNQVVLSRWPENLGITVFSARSLQEKSEICSQFKSHLEPLSSLSLLISLLVDCSQPSGPILVNKVSLGRIREQESQKKLAKAILLSPEGFDASTKI
ncbi:hypothetical protein VNO77_03296 [Canavalia gladiata]|uniref:Uncharacterized protein n=1 Tax=Canavalia gladiata TaxID=3824 RepID=A0AAN9RC37_CANGL